MQVLQITHDYPYTSVYQLLFQELIQFSQLKVIIPLKQKDKFMSFTEDVSPLYCLKSAHLAFWENIKLLNAGLLKVVDPREFDISHAHFLLIDGELAYQLKKRYGIPYVVTVRSSCLGYLSNKYKPHLYMHGMRILLKADAVVFTSPIFKQQVIDRYVPVYFQQRIKKKSKVVPNGVDKFWLQNVYLHHRRINSGQICFLTVGTIEKNKNHFMVVKALELLRSKGFNIEYRIVGKCLDKSIYNELVRIPFIKYFEPRSKEKLVKLYREADIFILVSEIETFGLVYAEAMTQGLPVIYSKGQGFDGQFKEGEVGYHADSNSPNDICQAIEKILCNYENISQKLPVLARKFDWTLIAKEYDCLYKNIRLGVTL